MAVYDLEEQEKIDALKAWWREYGTLIIVALVGFVLIVAGVRGWRYYQETRAVEAATLYSSLEKQASDATKIREIAGDLKEKYPSSPYAARAALIAARSAYEAGDTENAKSQLEWVVEHAKEQALRDLARLRVATIEYGEQNFAQALHALEAQHGQAFDGLYAELRGDILAAQGKLPEAREAYQAALRQADSAYRALIELKMDALGGAAR
jgi:predicted negative regulator of RcsB-dependent stress response